jgi:signal transduction histidine kinase
MFRRNAAEMRILILAPVGRDAALLSETVGMLNVDSAIAADSNSLLQMLDEGAGAAIVAEEALLPSLVERLSTWLASQPQWSDIPFIVLTSQGRPTRQSHRRETELQALGNFALIERPARPETIQSAVRTALRARARQYEIRSRQESLVQANADLEQFAHSVSHDLREPLRGIGIYTDLLTRDYEPSLEEKGKEYLSAIRSSATRMDALLNDLLSYAHASSISEDGLALIHANEPLNFALENLAGAIQESNACITAGALPTVRVHASHLSQIFQNLIGNAIKYRKDNEQPRVTVSALRSDGHWIFTVADNGIGVPSAYRESIFGIFKRLHTHNKYSGTGMGLAICRRIVERYRGRIWVESESGRGSAFFFTIPA